MMTNWTKNHFATSTLPTTLRLKPALQPYYFRQKRLYSPRTHTLLIQCKPKWVGLKRLCDDSLKNVPHYAMSEMAFSFGDLLINIRRMKDFAVAHSESFTMKKGGAAAKPCGAVSVPVTKGRFPEAICHAKHPNTRNGRGSPRRSARKSSARRGCAGIREAGEAV